MYDLVYLCYEFGVTVTSVPFFWTAILCDIVNAIKQKHRYIYYTVYSFLTIYSLFWSNRFTISYLLIFVFLFLYFINGFEDGWKKWIHAKRTRKGFISADSLSFSCATQISIDVCIPYLYELEGGEHRPREIPLRFKFVPSKFRREIGRGVSFLR